MSVLKATRWVAYWWFTSWSHISFGFHVDVESPNIEIHLPFGFFRIGRTQLRCYDNAELDEKPYGVQGEWVACPQDSEREIINEV